jgi:hypothetical protein
MSPSASQLVEQTRLVINAIAPIVPPKYLPFVQIIPVVISVAAWIIDRLWQRRRQMRRPTHASRHRETNPPGFPPRHN